MNHPSRSGAISAELFLALCDELMDKPFELRIDTPRDYLKHRIMNAALMIALRRAARRFRWRSDYRPSVEIDLAGYVYNSDSCGPNRMERNWLETEVEKISRKALIILQGI